MFVSVVFDTKKPISDVQNILQGSNAEGHTSSELDETMRYTEYFILISSKEINRQDILPTFIQGNISNK